MVRYFNQNKAGILCTDFTRWCGTQVNTPPSGLVFKWKQIRYDVDCFMLVWYSNKYSPLSGAVFKSKQIRYGVDCFTLVWYSSKYSSVWYSSKYSPLLVWCSDKKEKEGTMWIVSHWWGTPVSTPPCGAPVNTPPFSDAVFQSKQSRYSVDCFRWCGTPVNALHFRVRRSSQWTAQGVRYAMVPRWFSTPVNTLLSGPALQTKNNNTMNTVSNYLHVGLVFLWMHSPLVQHSRRRTTQWIQYPINLRLFNTPQNTLPSGAALQTKENTMNTVAN